MYLADPSPLKSGFNPNLIYVEFVKMGVGDCFAEHNAVDLSVLFHQGCILTFLLM
jgi:hypothetical protein